MTARRIVLLVVAVLVALAGAAALLRPGRPADPEPAAVAVVPDPVAAPEVEPSLLVSEMPPPAFAGAPPAPHRPPPASSRVPERTATPAPFVATFQTGTTRPLPARRSPTATLAVPANVDGCDRGYGTPTQCVPWKFPPGVTGKCAWLAANGFTRLTVTGPDRHRLDPDQDGLACNP
ncbi:MAG: hypothetical protein ABW046_12380 [Actinoplanes sp.]